MKKAGLALALCGLLVVASAGAALALGEEERREFERIMAMEMTELTDAATALLAQKYPDENWDAWDFPSYVFIDQATEASYKIAVKEPRLLGVANVADKGAVVPCYCTCDRFGHANLLHCFWRDGRPGGAFDEHGSQCAVCMRQAFLAFLWGDLGASHEEIIRGMEEKFAPLIRKIEEGKF